MSELAQIAVGSWLMVVVIWLAALEVSTRRLLRSMRDKDYSTWRELGDPKGMWDLVRNDSDHRFREFVQEKRYQKLQEEALRVEFTSYLRRREWVTVAVGVFSLAVTVLLVLLD